jgi:hypothetical protein
MIIELKYKTNNLFYIQNILIFLLVRSYLGYTILKLIVLILYINIIYIYIYIYIYISIYYILYISIKFIKIYANFI